MKILIFSVKKEHYGELCGLCGLLGAETAAFFIGRGEDAASVPADIVYTVEQKQDIPAEGYFKTLLKTLKENSFDAVFISADRRGRYMAAKLAAVMDTVVLSDLSGIENDNGCIKGRQLYYGGAGVRTVKSKGLAVVTIPVGSAEPVVKKPSEVVTVSYVEDAGRLKIKEVRKKEGEAVNLAAAKKIVGVGRGFASKNDLNLAVQLAAAIEAEMGCSRPIAEGEAWMDSARYIGVSGVVIKPDVYIAIGISGQIQHMIGVNESKLLIAINKDKNAPIFKNCDYGIVGDLYKIVPVLTELIKKG